SPRSLTCIHTPIRFHAISLHYALPIFLEGLHGPAEHAEVVGIADARDVPAVGDEARRHVLAEGNVGVALDADVVVVDALHRLRLDRKSTCLKSSHRRNSYAVVFLRKKR